MSEGILESNLKVDGIKIGLGNSKPEQFEFPGRLLSGDSITESAPEVTIALTSDRLPEVVVISADTYELKYVDTTTPKDKEVTTYVEYQPNGAPGWTILKSAHVFKRRDGIDLSDLKTVKFRVKPIAVKDKSVKVEVYIGLSLDKATKLSK